MARGGRERWEEDKARGRENEEKHEREEEETMENEKRKSEEKIHTMKVQSQCTCLRLCKRTSMDYTRVQRDGRVK